MENKYIYKIKGSIETSEQCDNDSYRTAGKHLKNEFDTLKEFMDENTEELAQYIWEKEPIYGIVTKIEVDLAIINEEVVSLTTVEATRKLTEAEQKCLLDYITGQFSDGFGEGLEQQEYYSYWDTVEERIEDEESEEGYYYDDIEYHYFQYLHLWQYKTFTLEIISEEEVAVE